MDGGSLGIVADTCYDVINHVACQKHNLRKIHHYCRHRIFRCWFYVSQKVDIA